MYVQFFVYSVAHSNFRSNKFKGQSFYFHRKLKENLCEWTFLFFTLLFCEFWMMIWSLHLYSKTYNDYSHEIFEYILLQKNRFFYKRFVISLHNPSWTKNGKFPLNQIWMSSKPRRQTKCHSDYKYGMVLNHKDELKFTMKDMTHSQKVYAYLHIHLLCCFQLFHCTELKDPALLVIDIIPKLNTFSIYYTKCRLNTFIHRHHISHSLHTFL